MIENAWEQNLWQLLYQLDPDTKKLTKQKKNHKKKVLSSLTKPF